MTDKLKEIIENAPVKTSGAFRCLFFLSNGEYDGFWGKNGYDNIMIYGFDDDLKEWCKIAAYADKFDIFSIEKDGFNLHIPHDLGIPVIWFNKSVYIDNTLMLSNVVGRLGKYEYDFSQDTEEEEQSSFEEADIKKRELRQFIQDLIKDSEKTIDEIRKDHEQGE